MITKAITLVTYGLLEEMWSAKVANFKRSDSGVRTSRKSIPLHTLLLQLHHLVGLIESLHGQPDTIDKKRG